LEFFPLRGGFGGGFELGHDGDVGKMGGIIRLEIRNLRLRWLGSVS